MTQHKIKLPNTPQDILFVLTGLKLIAKTLRLSVLISLTLQCLPLLIYTLIPADWNKLTLIIYACTLIGYTVGTSRTLNPDNRNYTPTHQDTLKDDNNI